MQKNKRILILLIFISVFMFGFTFALIPFYNAICKALGINGKTNTTGVVYKNVIDNSRTITIQFLSNKNNELPWDFYPKKNKL